MPNTYTLISSNVLSSSAASVTFSAIPSTYTDLVILYSARTDLSSSGDAVNIKFNGSSVAEYSYTTIRGNGSTATSFRSSSDTRLTITNAGADGATATANTFGSVEIYIPSYTASQNKPSSVFAVQENNATGAFINPIANLWSNTSAITSIAFTSDNAANFVSGSSFYLYGIKNS